MNNNHLIESMVMLVCCIDNISHISIGLIIFHFYRHRRRLFEYRYVVNHTMPLCFIKIIIIIIYIVPSQTNSSLLIVWKWKCDSLSQSKSNEFSLLCVLCVGETVQANENLWKLKIINFSVFKNSFLFVLSFYSLKKKLNLKISLCEKKWI